MVHFTKSTAHMSLLRNGDSFPHFTLRAVHGGQLILPDALVGSFGVVIGYRGAWCPFCIEQLREYAEVMPALEALGTKVVAFSVDDEEAAGALADKVSAKFSIGYGASAKEISGLLGSFTNDDPAYLQPMAFVLSPEGKVLASTYSSNAIGRLRASEVLRFVPFVKSRTATQS